MTRIAIALMAALVGLASSACDVDDTVDEPVVDAAVGGAGGGGAGGTGGAPDAGASGCASDDDCAGATPRCRDDGACVACLGAADCPADRPVCDGANACVPLGQGSCREAFDCPVDQPECSLPAEGDVGVCVACFDDLDCEDGPRPLCSTTGLCVDADGDLFCVDDAECGPGRACLDGACEFP